LLGDCRCRGDHSAVAAEIVARPFSGEDIDAMVEVKTLILSCEHTIDQLLLICEIFTGAVRVKSSVVSYPSPRLSGRTAMAMQPAFHEDPVED